MRQIQLMGITKMNKLLVSSNILEVNNNIYDLEVKESELIINLENTNKLYLINQFINKLVINMNDFSSLDIYLYNDRSIIKEIIINQTNNTTINFYYNFINYNDNSLSIINNVNNSNNDSNIYIKNISCNELSNIEVLANIKNNTRNNNIVESIDAVTNGGTVSVLPDIVCESNEVVANHYTTIGCVDNESLKYLMSKGLSEGASKKLILNGFINSKMDEYMITQINEFGGEKNE